MNRSKIKPEASRVVVRPHRQRKGTLGALADFLATSDGEILPAAVIRDNQTQEYVVIGGERRWLAALRNPLLPAFVIVCDVWSDFLAWLVLDKMREHPAHPSMPMPVTDVIAITETVSRYLRPGRDDRLDSTLAEYFGIPENRIGETRSLKRILVASNPDDIQAMAEQEWANVAKGLSSPSAAFQRVRRAQVRRDLPPADAGDQRRRLRGAAGVCAGLVDGLANFGDVSPELTGEEVAEYIEALSAGRRALESVIRKLNGAAS